MLQPLLKSPSIENAAQCGIVQCVIGILVESQEVLVTVGEKLQDPTLKRYFLTESLKRADFIDELGTALGEQGVRRLRDRGSVAATLHRTWARLKSRLFGGDHSLLVTAEQGEDAVRETYSKAMETNLPGSLRQILMAQARHIQLTHAYVETARDHCAALSKAAPKMEKPQNQHYDYSGTAMRCISMQHIPLASAYLCPDCNSIGNCADRCPACASPSLLGLASVLDRSVESKLVEYA
jgi:uncharacterized protein (TIGR02284 family)